MTPSPLTRKALRDLWHLRGQVIAIAAVLACGVATFVMSVSTLRSLERALETYYERQRFAEIFGHLERAPQALAARLAEIPGVETLQTRVVEHVTLDMPGLDEPAVGRLISLPPQWPPRLNALHMRRGALPRSRTRHEVLVSEAFAEAHALEPGDAIDAVLNGRLESLVITGIVLSPEFIYQIREGEVLPDHRRFGVLWMDEEELAAAFDMEGAFNDLALTLSPGASAEAVIERVDQLTEPYGGRGAYARADQVSHRFVSNEIRELRGMAQIVPVIFLGVAAFLLNVVMARLIAAQREQIAAIKALGYSRREIGVHYLQIVMLIVLVGVAVGTAIGAWMGSGLTRLYTQFFSFPIFEYRLGLADVVMATTVSTVAGLAGTFGAVRGAMLLPPAEAMQPQPPPSFKPTIVERSGLHRLLGPAARMVLRQLERRPRRAVLSATGIALAAAILVVGNYMGDAVAWAIDHEFYAVQRYDLMVGFNEAASPGALGSLRAMEGVVHIEPFRGVATRLRAGHRTRRVGIMGLPAGGTLFRPRDMHGGEADLSAGGLVLSAKLGELLGVGPGDFVTVEVLQDDRPVRRVIVSALLDDFSGTNAYMSFDGVNRLMSQDRVASGAFILADAALLQPLYRRLKEAPQVASVTVKEAMVRSFSDTIARSMNVMRVFNVMFAVIIAVGVVYNSARISLAERSRELATLRVIGFTRGEISMIQLGELGLLVVVAVPAGLLLGYVLAALTTAAVDTELFRIPLVINRSTYGLAALVVTAAAIGSGLIVRRMIDRLDLVGVLKTRD